ncbi:MAG TPA: CBS domain-containing protein [Caulobacteraceae bacterium]|jgi:CBS domain-containing protein
MKISDIMSRGVTVARPTDTIQSVAQRMASEDVGAIPVCDGQRLQGMITDRDITIRAVAKGDINASISEVMTSDIEYCFEDDDLEDVADKMADSQIRRIPVVDQDRNLVGIVALADLAREGKDKLVGDTVQDISQPNRAF